MSHSAPCSGNPVGIQPSTTPVLQLRESTTPSLNPTLSCARSVDARHAHAPVRAPCPGGGVMNERVPINNPPPSHSLSGVQYWHGENERTRYNEVRRPGSATGQTHTRLRCCGAQHARARCCALPFATLCVFSRLFHVCLPLDVVMMIYTCSPCKSAFLGANVFVILSCWYV